MVQSLNTKVELVMDSTSFLGLSDYGKVMIGDRAFEFYNSRDKSKYIQIPWEEIDYVEAASVLKGRWIPRYAINTKKNGRYMFSSRHPKEVLRSIRDHLGPNKMFHSLTFFQIIMRGLKVSKDNWVKKHHHK
ncbi:MAG: DUF956 family protein [Liquorilactobacillus ghanensis]|jgi:hypothetical protein|uniref:Regulator of the mannose operon, ManO n=1 Tax=Liquorilactobacillus ghanensis DSM 18630 TaxID=1423750 RepID=A0A0R1VJZ9_9LACO|nr:DUF956 family protein [Liquorilactobacillus ghanensis]KRM05826.1 hypothetical protein FC89_GL001540 [Liquorilactobacillus ghanensis DSM 18630]